MQKERQSTPGVAVLLSELTDREKVDDETLDKCRTEGIDIDVELEQRPKFDAKVNDTELDIEKEKEKSKNCEFWPDENEFIKQFNLTELDAESSTKMKDLLLSFKHCFYNEQRPDQFKKGMQVKPVKITTIPNPPKLRKEPPRRLNEVKLGHLKKFLVDLKEQGVITELDNFEKQIYLAPVHIVLEERYVASERRNVFKSRFCLDQRLVNRIIVPCAQPLPLVDEFRRSIAAEGFCVFTNLDLASGYHQLPVETKNVDHLFGFRALGRVYVIQRLSMGWQSSPGIFQALMNEIFACHEHAHPYIDDVTIASKTMEEHLQIDLPKALALCSKYNILLKGKKADLAKDETRVLGFRVTQSNTSLSCEKVDKI